MNNAQKQKAPDYKPNLEKLLYVAMKPIELKAEVITAELQANYGGNIGDYILVLPTGNCFVLNKTIFEIMFQAIPKGIIK